MENYRRYLYVLFSVIILLCNLTGLVAMILFIVGVQWHTTAYLALKRFNINVPFGVTSWLMIPSIIVMVALYVRNFFKLFMKRPDKFHGLVNFAFIFLFGIFAIFVFFIYKSKTHEASTKIQMYSVLKSYTTDSHVAAKFNGLEIDLSCCGVVGYTDHKNGTFGVIPKSCCGYDKGSQNQGGTSRCELSNHKFHHTGCARVYFALMRMMAWASAILSITFVIQNLGRMGYTHYHAEYIHYKTNKRLSIITN